MQSDDDALYREIIDRLVHDCHQGQGQIAAERLRAGVWNPHATAEDMPEQRAVNELLARMTKDDRETFARLLATEFESGVHATLVALHELEVPPFEKAYEGTPFHDFVGRLADWQWPSARKRR